MKHIVLLLWLLNVTIAQAQYTFKAQIVDAETLTPLPRATIKTGTMGAVSNVDGLVEITGIPNDTIIVTTSYVGYETLTKTFVFPISDRQVIALTPGEELEEVIVTSTRTSRTIETIPTRIEVIGAEELEEKAIMRSSNIAMVLRESTGIQMQQTSASSANQSIRIPGLDGRYTQILKDGFPLYGGFSGGLSIMQIPPLDLKQIEVIKGSNSTLFGGGAIAGLINLVSLVPETEGRCRIMLDQTQANGTTFNTFYAKRHKKLGFSLYASANRQQAYDPNNDDFSDIPKIRSVTINPSLFYYFKEGTSLRLSLNGTFENRLGGDMKAINDNPGGIHQFTEENATDRLSYQLTYVHRIADNKTLNIKNSLTYFTRNIAEPDFTFKGRQTSSFSEIAYNFGTDKANWITGINIYTDHFDEDAQG